MKIVTKIRHYFAKARLINIYDSGKFRGSVLVTKEPFRSFQAFGGNELCYEIDRHKARPLIDLLKDEYGAMEWRGLGVINVDFKEDFWMEGVLGSYGKK